MPDYLADHEFAPQPSEVGEGKMHAGCTCGWWSRANVALESTAKMLWKEHLQQVLAAKPITKG